MSPTIPASFHSDGAHPTSSSRPSDLVNADRIAARKSSVAQLNAAARYREKNKSALQAKARERMARRRALVADLPDEERQALRRNARASDARYRRRHASTLASRQTDRRAMRYISKHGCDAWLRRRDGEQPGDEEEEEEEEDTLDRQESASALLRKRQALRRHARAPGDAMPAS
ncbi:hypothetical protein R3P38DRAFT_3170302 [Favolaschia claudopus]|uniref:Uncharacterized protein n=1 Tax=Favolaschia claudopus TaxID=2862362 RepID=A0AAW0DVW7_9AGAR